MFIANNDLNKTQWRCYEQY